MDTRAREGEQTAQVHVGSRDIKKGTCGISKSTRQLQMNQVFQIREWSIEGTEFETTRAEVGQVVKLLDVTGVDQEATGSSSESSSLYVRSLRR